MKKLSNTGWVVLLAAALITVIGFMWSDEQKYPTAAKFSGWIILGGAITMGLVIATVWNPIPKIA